MKMRYAAITFGMALVMACSAETEVATGDQAASDPHAGHQMGPMSEEAAQDKAEAARALQERFGAKSCSDADLAGSMKRTEATGREQIVRGFSASVACAKELRAAVKEAGFTPDEEGVFVSAPSATPKETVRIEIAEDASGAVVEWEIDNR